MLVVRQQRKEITLSRRRWLLVGAVTVVVAVAVLFVPRVHRTIAYRRIVSSPSASRRLSVQPTTMAAHFEKPAEIINTGYSTFSVPSGVFTHMDSHGTWLNLQGGDFSVLFTEVNFASEFSVDGNYSFFHRAMQESPVTAAQAFSMNDSEFIQHVALIMAKLSNSYADRGITFFETTRTKGIIRLGSEPYFAHGVHLIVWDQLHPLSQEITITVSEPDLRNDTAQAIASTFEFTVDVLPDHDKLCQMSTHAAEAFSKRAGEPISL